MTDGQYCEACQRFLRGEAHIDYNNVSSSSDFSHHANADAFKNALDLPCDICSLAWEGGGRQRVSRNDISCGTRAYIWKTNKNEPSVRILRFRLDLLERFSSGLMLAPIESTSCNNFLPNMPKGSF